MKIRRFVMRTVDWHKVEVVDLLTNTVVQVCTHEWRAEKLINELTSNASRAGEPTVVNR